MCLYIVQRLYLYLNQIQLNKRCTVKKNCNNFMYETALNQSAYSQTNILLSKYIANPGPNIIWSQES
jgi:hypothetical protein